MTKIVHTRIVVKCAKLVKGNGGRNEISEKERNAK